MTFYDLKLSHPAYTEYPGSLPPLHVSLYLQPYKSYKSKGRKVKKTYTLGFTGIMIIGAQGRKWTHHPMIAIPESKQSFRFKNKSTNSLKITLDL